MEDGFWVEGEGEPHQYLGPKELASGLTFLGKSSLILIIRIMAGSLLG